MYAVDIDPQQKRLATCGMDGAVRIWNLAAVLDAGVEGDPQQPRQLAFINDHGSCVNVVRFSHCGHYVASGSDERLAMVHELKPGRGQAVFGSSEVNVENWRVVQALRGHENNVVDVAWSPDDRLLATASLDRHASVFEWRTGERGAAGRLGGAAQPHRGRVCATMRHGCRCSVHPPHRVPVTPPPPPGARLARLEHASFCKGVAWDPLGSYLASQGDDGVRVWRCEGWAPQGRLSRHFERSSTQTFSLRWGSAGAGDFGCIGTPATRHGARRTDLPGVSQACSHWVVQQPAKPPWPLRMPRCPPAPRACMAGCAGPRMAATWQPPMGMTKGTRPTLRPCTRESPGAAKQTRRMVRWGSMPAWASPVLCWLRPMRGVLAKGGYGMVGLTLSAPVNTGMPGPTRCTGLQPPPPAAAHLHRHLQTLCSWWATPGPSHACASTRACGACPSGKTRRQTQQTQRRRLAMPTLQPAATSSGPASSQARAAAPSELLPARGRPQWRQARAAPLPPAARLRAARRRPCWWLWAAATASSPSGRPRSTAPCLWARTSSGARCHARRAGGKGGHEGQRGAGSGLAWAAVW